MKKLLTVLLVLFTNSLFAQQVEKDTTADPLSIYGEAETVSFITASFKLDARYKLSDHRDISSWTMYTRDPRLGVAGTYLISDLMYNVSNEDYSITFSAGLRAMRIYQPIQAVADGIIFKVRFKIY